MSIGKRIKITREQLNMTLEEVATKCNTTKQTIYKYENEIVTNIPYDKIVLLAQALNVSPSYLFGWEEKKNSPGEFELTEGELAMLELFRSIPIDHQPMAVEMIRAALNTLK